MSYPWHTSVVERVARLKESRQLPHSLALTSNPGWGLDALVHTVTHLLLETESTLPLAEFAHPDFRYVAAEGTEIKVDAVRAANEFAVAGGDRTWTAVANLGASHKGGGPSSGLILSDNDASADSAPLLGISFRSHDSQGEELFDNSGSALVDHDRCGDGQLEVVE